VRLDWNPTNYQFAWQVVGEHMAWLREGVQLTLETRRRYSYRNLIRNSWEE
jgi:hypothetical protein